VGGAVTGTLTIDGGTGDDTLNFTTTDEDGVTVKLAATAAAGTIGVTNVETINGTDKADSFNVGSGLAAGTTLKGGAGVGVNDTLVFSGADSVSANINGDSAAYQGFETVDVSGVSNATDGVSVTNAGATGMTFVLGAVSDARKVSATGGTGADTFEVGAVTGTLTIDGGTGTDVDDTLQLTGTAAAMTFAADGKLTKIDGTAVTVSGIEKFVGNDTVGTTFTVTDSLTGALDLTGGTGDDTFTVGTSTP